MIKKPRLNQGRKIKVSISHSEADTSIDYPIFCLKYIHSDYHLTGCDKDQKAAFIEQLCKLSHLTWNDIKLAHKHGLGTEKIARNSIKANLPDFISEEVSFLLAFRFFGKMPFLGHRNGAVLHIIFIDPKGSVYSH